MKAHVHQLVGKDHSLFEAQCAIAGIDDRRDRLLGHVDIDEIE